MIEALEDRTLLSTITVTSSLDTVDANDGITTLREAILDANALAGHDTIVFNINGAGVHTIDVMSALPTITDSVTIDATSQAGYAGMPLIELDGSFAGTFSSGLHIIAGNTTVRGLSIHSFNFDGIHIEGAGGNTISENFIGTDATGTLVRDNRLQGVRIENSTNNLLERNVISGNGANGVAIVGNLSVGNIVRDNHIGTDVTGTLDLGNRFDGVLVTQGNNNLIVGNVISGNGRYGVSFFGRTYENRLEGNLIGTDASGSVAIANANDGVYLADGAHHNMIGGDTAAAGNVIAFNGGNGVTVYYGNTLYNSVRANAIHSNVGLGIDLGDDGVSLNDAGDADVGANLTQNYPTMVSATENTLVTQVVGSFSGTANMSVTLDFYANAADGSSQVWLGAVVVVTDGLGNAAFDAALSVVAAGGSVVVGTSTGADGSTSEFSTGVSVVSVDPPAPEPPTDPVLTVEEQIGVTINTVNELLNKRAAKAVSATLNTALKQLAKGKVKSAVKMLKASAHKIEALVRSGRLSSEDGQVLLDQLENVVSEIRSENGLRDKLFSGKKFGKLLHKV